MKYSCLILVLVVFVGTGSYGQLEVRMPRLGEIFNRITNTTFNFIRGGVNIFGRSIDRIIDTFGEVEDRLNALLHEFRRQIVRGIPEFNIPVLDPLKISKIEFDVAHEAAKAKGYAKNITVRHISKFQVDKLTFSDLGGWKFKLDLNITFPYLTATGMYKINGMLGESFSIFGDGPFWLNLTDLKIGTSSILKYEFPRLRVSALNIDIKLRKLNNKFDNLMGDEEVGDLYNKALSSLAPEALNILWPELKGPVEKQVMKYINHILENATIAGLVRRLFNIR